MLKISNISKTFYPGTVNEKQALRGIDLHLAPGDFVTVIGGNGAGKSTTMNILTGYLSSNSGVAKVGGIDILEKPDEAKKQIGFLPEQPPLYVDMTVQEYLNFVFELKGCTLNKEKHIDEIHRFLHVLRKTNHNRTSFCVWAWKKSNCRS